MASPYKNNDNLIDYSDVEVFEMVHSGALARFPINFWEGYNNRDIAKELTKHLFENILHWTIDDIKNKSISEAFYDNRLGNMVKTVFNGSSYDAIINAYPELIEWFIKNSREQKESKETGELRILYTDEELIQNIQDKAKELNHIPYLRHMKNPDGHIYLARFKSWTKSLIAAELIEDIYKDIEYSEENRKYVQDLLKEFVIAYEKMPTQPEVLELISEGEMKLYFRSYTGLCSYLESEYSKEELIKIIKNKAKKLGRSPVGKDMILPRAIIFIDMFGSWNNCLKAAGLIKDRY
jgi:polyhydroxyalkanoate synthesis regulator phasin